MQREIFQQLVSNLEEHCQNVLVGSEIDYRRLIAKRSVEQVSFFYFFKFALFSCMHSGFYMCSCAIFLLNLFHLWQYVVHFLSSK